MASEKANCSTVGELALDQCAEEALTLLDSAPCQHSSTWHQMRMASVIRFVVSLVLVACVATLISHMVLLPPSNTRSHQLRVSEEFDFPRKESIVTENEEFDFSRGESIVKYFEKGMDTMSDIFGHLAEQVNLVKREADEARAHMKEWADHAVAKNMQITLEYANGLSDVADELQNAEDEFVGLCDTVAQLLKSLGEELERKVVSAESKRTSQDIKDEQKIMSEIIHYTEDGLEQIKKQFKHTKSKLHNLSATPEYFSIQIKDEIDQPRNQNNIWEGGLVGGFVVAIGTCGNTGIATYVTRGAVARTLVVCGAAVTAEGAAVVYFIYKNFENRMKRLETWRKQLKLNDLEQKCDSLGGQAETDQKRLIKVQRSVHAAESVLMSIPTLAMWKHQVLPRNKKLVKQLQDVVGSTDR